LSSAVDEPGICAASAQSISSTLNTLSVSIWLLDDRRERLLLAASTSTARASDGETNSADLPEAAGMLPEMARPFNLEKAPEAWAAALRLVAVSQFPTGGDRWCVPLVTRERWLGAVVLADRVGGVPYTAEERDLLHCLADQIATTLLNARLTAEILRGREIEAFRTMSAFFVHDLKNVASTLTLMLQNLPLHFDSAEFREDALRGIGKTVGRMNELIGRLGALRQKLEIKPVTLDLNELVEETLRSTPLGGEVNLRRQIEPLPVIAGDREQLQSVVTNLLLNAADAIGGAGEVIVQTSQRAGWVTVSISDDGCGMSPEFLRTSLFRPFHSTKKNGLGIGMFQSKIIVEAHGGTVQVKSEIGKGSTFSVALPINAPGI
jgi:putative PEP-CTERM system histidine kinase